GRSCSLERRLAPPERRRRAQRGAFARRWRHRLAARDPWRDPAWLGMWRHLGCRPNDLLLCLPVVSPRYANGRMGGSKYSRFLRVRPAALLSVMSFARSLPPNVEIVRLARRP